MAYIFFDIDGTLMSADAKIFPQVRPAWDRLQAGVAMTSLQFLRSSNPILVEIGQKLKLPDDFDWKMHTGETDLGVIVNIIKSLGISHGESSYYGIPSAIMENMFQYYIQEMRNVETCSTVNEYKFSGITKYNSLVNTYKIQLPPIEEIPLFYPVYSDVWTVLCFLKNCGHKLGIVTGNAKDVTREKLRLSGLNIFFDDESLWLTGDMSESRAELLLLGSLILFKINREFQTLNYVGDAIKDIQAVQQLRDCIYFRGFMTSLGPEIPMNIFIRWPEHSLVAITNQRGYGGAKGQEVIREPGNGYPPDITTRNTKLFYFKSLSQVPERLGLKL